MTNDVNNRNIGFFDSVDWGEDQEFMNAIEDYIHLKGRRVKVHETGIRGNYVIDREEKDTWSVTSTLKLISYCTGIPFLLGCIGKLIIRSGKKIEPNRVKPDAQSSGKDVDLAAQKHFSNAEPQTNDKQNSPPPQQQTVEPQRVEPEPVEPQQKIEQQAPEPEPEEQPAPVQIEERPLEVPAKELVIVNTPPPPAIVEAEPMEIISDEEEGSEQSFEQQEEAHQETPPQVYHEAVVNEPPPPPPPPPPPGSGVKFNRPVQPPVAEEAPVESPPLAKKKELPPHLQAIEKGTELKKVVKEDPLKLAEEKIAQVKSLIAAGAQNEDGFSAEQLDEIKELLTDINKTLGAGAKVTQQAGGGLFNILGSVIKTVADGAAGTVKALTPKTIRKALKAAGREVERLENRLKESVNPGVPNVPRVQVQKQANVPPPEQQETPEEKEAQAKKLLEAQEEAQKLLKEQLERRRGSVKPKNTDDENWDS